MIEKAVKGNLYNIGEETTVNEEELGRKLFELCALAVKSGIDAEESLISFTKKFIKNFNKIEENT